MESFNFSQCAFQIPSDPSYVPSYSIDTPDTLSSDHHSPFRTAFALILPLEERVKPNLILLQTRLGIYRTVREMQILITFLNQSSGSLTRTDVFRFAYSTFCLALSYDPRSFDFGKASAMFGFLRISNLEVRSHVHKETFHIANELDFVFSHSPSYYSRTFRAWFACSNLFRLLATRYPMAWDSPKDLIKLLNAFVDVLPSHINVSRFSCVPPRITPRTFGASVILSSYFFF